MIFASRVGAIELIGDEVRVAVVRTGRAAPQLLEVQRAQAVYESPESRRAALAAALDDCLGRLTSRPTAFVLCCSSLYSIVRTLTIPFRGARRVAAAVPLELEPYLAFPLEDLLVDFMTIQEVDGETEVIALGIRRSVLDEQMDILRDAGVEAEAVNLDAVALTGLWQSLNKNPKSLNAILHIREQGAIFAVTHNRRLAFVRHISMAPEDLIEAPVAVAREIGNSLRSFFAKWRGEDRQVDVLHLTGVQLSPAERDTIEQSLGVPVQDVIMLDAAGAQPDGAPGDPFNTWEAAAGTANAAAGGGFSLDFVRTERDWNSMVRPIVTHLMFSSCLALLVLLGLMFYYYQGAAKYNAEGDRLQTQLDDLMLEVSSIQDQTLGADVQTEVFADPTLLDLLREISTKMPDNKVTIDEIRIAPPAARGAWINIEGKASDSAVLYQVFDDLKTSSLFRVQENPDVRVEGPLTFFRIQADRVSNATELPEGEAAANAS